MKRCCRATAHCLWCRHLWHHRGSFVLDDVVAASRTTHTHTHTHTHTLPCCDYRSLGLIRKQLIRGTTKEPASYQQGVAGGKKFNAGARGEVCGPNIPQTLKHTATPGTANRPELLGCWPTSVSCLQTHISKSQQTWDRDSKAERAHIDKGKSKDPSAVHAAAG
ncbi:hypothetical protein WN55_11130 [Dufourea novaeangliae]|uniref:Uncharacterized protein n=1 Tax=Dufourea novaeangliae TaxID=178035 RepID=A0A154PC80_DUFNO|nr:hypothetical protein WN55_11130 [Dufourea novaeangliae]